MRESRVQKAIELWKDNGYNCAQAVAATYCDLVNVDVTTAFKAMEAFGAGMGAKMGTCGAVAGAVFISSFVTSNGNIDSDKSNKSKLESYKLSGMITRAFHEICGSLTCNELKDSKGEHFTSCMDCIAHGCVLVETIVFEGEFEDQTFFK